MFACRIIVTLHFVIVHASIFLPCFPLSFTSVCISLFLDPWIWSLID